MQSIEIEFPTTGESLSHALSAVAELQANIEQADFHLQSMVRVDGQLVNLWSDFDGQPSNYVYRVHVDGISSRRWEELTGTHIKPLAGHGVTVRQPLAVH